MPDNIYLFILSLIFTGTGRVRVERGRLPRDE